MPTRAPLMLRMLGLAARAWWDDDALRLGASLAYYTLFAIAPILLVATAIAGMFFGTEAVRGEIVGQLDQWRRVHTRLRPAPRGEARA